MPAEEDTRTKRMKRKGKKRGRKWKKTRLGEMSVG
jgi:hypothetical protein